MLQPAFHSVLGLKAFPEFCDVRHHMADEIACVNSLGPARSTLPNAAVGDSPRLAAYSNGPYVWLTGQ